MPSSLIQTKILCWIKTQSKLVFHFFLWYFDYMQSHIKRHWNTSLTAFALCSWENSGSYLLLCWLCRKMLSKKTLLHFLVMLFINLGFKKIFYSRQTSVSLTLILNKKDQTVFRVFTESINWQIRWFSNRRKKTQGSRPTNTFSVSIIFDSKQMFA